MWLKPCRTSRLLFLPALSHADSGLADNSRESARVPVVHMPLLFMR